MILYDSGLVKLDYDPTTDILFVDFPVVDSIFPIEIGRSFELIADYVRNYDIKKLLIDAQKAQVEIPAAELKVLFTGLAAKLSTTRLQKVARIESPSTIRENVARQLFEGQQLSFNYQSFSDKETALTWLVSY